MQGTSILYFHVQFANQTNPIVYSTNARQTFYKLSALKYILHVCRIGSVRASKMVFHEFTRHVIHVEVMDTPSLFLSADANACAELNAASNDVYLRKSNPLKPHWLVVSFITFLKTTVALGLGSHDIQWRPRTRGPYGPKVLT